MYYTYSDRTTQDYLYFNSPYNDKQFMRHKFHLLYKFLDFIEEPFHCRRKLQLNLLGEQYDSKNWNSKCDNWLNYNNVTETEITSDAQLILEIIKSSGKKHTLLQTVDILKGRNEDFRSDKRVKYISKNYTESQVRRILVKMLALKILDEDFWQPSMTFAGRTMESK